MREIIALKMFEKSNDHWSNPAKLTISAMVDMPLKYRLVTKSVTALPNKT
jgi:hypothetical protein